MPETRLRIKTAQADVGDVGDAGDVGGDIGDPNPQEDTGQPLPANFATRLGTLAIANFILEKLQREANDYGINPNDFNNMIAGQINNFKAQNKLNDADFVTALSAGGQRQDAVRAQTAMFTGLFANLGENYNKTQVQQQEQVALQYCEEPVGQDWNGGKGTGQMLWKTMGERFQTQFNHLVEQYKQAEAAQAQPYAAQIPGAPAVPPPAVASSDRWTVTAQAEQMQGPLATGRYESVSQLRDDLVRMGPSPETYERFMTLVGPDREDDAKEALGSFYQGLAAALYALYEMLVDMGMANPLDAEIVETLMSQHPELSNNNEKEQEKASIHAGLFLPPPNSGLYTTADKIEKTAGGSVGGAGAGYPA